jgi:hypothetical protein
MKSTAIVIADSEETARAIDIYMKAVMADTIEAYFMTYHHPLLSGALVRQADIFIVELFSMDNIGQRAEGLLTAEKWLSLGKRALIVSGMGCADAVANPLYWDLAAADQLGDRIFAVLAAPVADQAILRPMKARFRQYCRPAKDPHHRA